MDTAHKTLWLEENKEFQVGNLSLKLAMNWIECQSFFCYENRCRIILGGGWTVKLRGLICCWICFGCNMRSGFKKKIVVYSLQKFVANSFFYCRSKRRKPFVVLVNIGARLLIIYRGQILRDKFDIL